MIKLIENSDRKYEFDFVLGINKIYPDYTRVSREYNDVYYYYAHLDEIAQLNNSGRISASDKLNECIECYNYYSEKECGNRCAIAFVLNTELEKHKGNMYGGTYHLGKEANIELNDIIFIDMYVCISGDGHGHKLSEYTGLVKKHGTEHIRNITKQKFDQLIDVDKVLELI